MCLHCVVLCASGAFVCNVRSSGATLLPGLLWTAGKSCHHCCSWDVVSAIFSSPCDTRWFCFFVSVPPLLLIQFHPFFAHLSTSDTALEMTLSSLFWGLDSACITDSASEKLTTLFCMASLCSTNIVAAVFKA